MDTEIKAEVWIPWREQPSRIKAMEFTKNWYESRGYKVVLVDTDDEVFNLSGCRNKAVKESKADVVIISDADTVPESTSLTVAIKRAHKTNLTTLPYKEYRSLGKTGSDQVLSGKRLNECDYYWVEKACSGVFVTTKRAWAKHYGQDENFKGWGCEDAAWEITQRTLCGEIPRVNGKVYALTHVSADKEGEETKNNFGRIYLYEQADGNKEAILRLVA